jgi:hypothetical protein
LQEIFAESAGVHHFGPAGPFVTQRIGAVTGIESQDAGTAGFGGTRIHKHIVATGSEERDLTNILTAIDKHVAGIAAGQCDRSHVICTIDQNANTAFAEELQFPNRPTSGLQYVVRLVISTSSEHESSHGSASHQQICIITAKEFHQPIIEPLSDDKTRDQELISSCVSIKANAANATACYQNVRIIAALEQNVVSHFSGLQVEQISVRSTSEKHSRDPTAINQNVGIVSAIKVNALIRSEVRIISSLPCDRSKLFVNEGVGSIASGELNFRDPAASVLQHVLISTAAEDDSGNTTAINQDVGIIATFEIDSLFQLQIRIISRLPLDNAELVIEQNIIAIIPLKADARDSAFLILQHVGIRPTSEHNA